MDVKFYNPFIQAAFTVLQAETGVEAERGPLSFESSADTPDDVTVMLICKGQTVRGVVLYTMSEKTALTIVSRILKQPFWEFDELAQSGVSELGNVITGRAGILLAEAGIEVTISTPVLLVGKGTLISTLDFKRLLIPMHTSLGNIQIHLALNVLSQTVSA